jgi:hypothetical protein
VAEVYAFTGTREPPEDWTPWVADLVDALPRGAIVVVGACRGLDALVAYMATERGLWVHAVVPGCTGPWLDPDWRRHCTSHERMPPDATFRQRDERVVALAAIFEGWLIAVPRWPEDDPRSRRSGTWMTVRFARRRCVPVHEERLWENGGSSTLNDRTAKVERRVGR